MRFPLEWEALGFVPAEWLSQAVSSYMPGHEQAPEHDRHGLFQWWLKRNPSKAQLVTLARLSWLDPDQAMAGYVRECISKSAAFDQEVAHAVRAS